MPGHPLTLGQRRDALLHGWFVDFTGTPIMKTDTNTRSVFSDYIGFYDI